MHGEWVIVIKVWLYFLPVLVAWGSQKGWPQPRFRRRENVPTRGAPRLSSITLVTLMSSLKWEETWVFPSNAGLQDPLSAPASGCTDTLQPGWEAFLQPPERPPALARWRPACRFPAQMDKRPWELRWSLWQKHRAQCLKTKIMWKSYTTY